MPLPPKGGNASPQLNVLITSVMNTETNTLLRDLMMAVNRQFTVLEHRIENLQGVETTNIGHFLIPRLHNDILPPFLIINNFYFLDSLNN